MLRHYIHTQLVLVVITVFENVSVDMNLIPVHVADTHSSLEQMTSFKIEYLIICCSCSV